MKTANEMKAEYSHLLGRVFSDREELLEAIEGTTLGTSRYRDVTMAHLGEFQDYTEVLEEEYISNVADNPSFYGHTSDEEIVVAWQSSDHVEDVIENIIQNFVVGRSLYFRTPSSESIPVQYISRGWRGTGPEEVITWDLMEFSYYKVEKMTASVPQKFLYNCGMPAYITSRDHKYLTRNGARVDKLRERGVPLKPLRYRPVNKLGYYERLAIIARKIEEEGKVSLDIAQ